MGVENRKLLGIWTAGHVDIWSSKCDSGFAKEFGYELAHEAAAESGDERGSEDGKGTVEHAASGMMPPIEEDSGGHAEGENERPAPGAAWPGATERHGKGGDRQSGCREIRQEHLQGPTRSA